LASFLLTALLIKIAHTVQLTTCSLCVTHEVISVCTLGRFLCVMVLISL
jgi:hypothetical protein